MGGFAMEDQSDLVCIGNDYRDRGRGNVFHLQGLPLEQTRLFQVHLALCACMRVSFPLGTHHSCASDRRCLLLQSHDFHRRSDGRGRCRNLVTGSWLVPSTSQDINNPPPAIYIPLHVCICYEFAVSCGNSEASVACVDSAL